MKKLITLSFALLLFIQTTISQNIGIGTPTPAEKLDVNGNINVNGTIKVNGIDGTAGQILMKNSTGTLVWGNPEEFKNFVTFGSGSGSWTVPAGVTRVYVEAWGGGGGGNWYAGGGGGGYVCGIITVTPASSITYQVGAEGAGSGNTGTNGGSSTVTYSPASITFTAQGGFGATFSSPFAFVGSGGPFSATGTFSYAGVNGTSGFPSVANIIQSSATAFHEISGGGNGGDAANGGGKGGRGSYQIFTISPVAGLRIVFGTNGGRPGGGGGSGYLGTVGSSGNGNGSGGGIGMVVIRY
jgi:hypothetical protein